VILLPIYAVRVVGKKEKQAIDAIEINAKSKKLPIKAVAYIPEIKGYILIEADDYDTVKKAITGFPFIRGILEKPIKKEEIERFFKERTAIQKFDEGDIVEIVGGPFKREKAKIISVDETKQEAKIELIDVSIPIPITIKLELLRKITS